MTLPNRENAVVPERKITDYLLSETNRDGRHKAAFFQRFGYAMSHWRRLRDDLLTHVDLPVAWTEKSPFGMRYIIEGIIHAPDGREPRIRTEWFIEHGTDFARLVT